MPSLLNLFNTIPSNPSHSSSSCSLQLNPTNFNSSPYSFETSLINSSLSPPYSPQIYPNFPSSPSYLPQICQHSGFTQSPNKLIFVSTLLTTNISIFSTLPTTNLSLFCVYAISIPTIFADLEFFCSTPNKCGGNNTLPVNRVTPIKEVCIRDVSPFQKRRTRGFLLLQSTKGKRMN